VPLDGRAAAESAEQQVDTSEAFACTTILGMVVVFFHAMFAQMEAHRREWIIKERSGGNGKTIHNRFHGECHGSVGISTRSDISTRHVHQEQPTEKEACQF
jgi:hypothetical protein